MMTLDSKGLIIMKLEHDVHTKTWLEVAEKVNKNLDLTRRSTVCLYYH